MKVKKLLLTILVIVSALSAALFAVSCSVEVITNDDSSYSQSSGDSQQGQSDSPTATQYKYRVEEYRQSVDGSEYAKTSKELSADAGSSVSVDIVNFDGFRHVVKDDSKESGVLDADNTLVLKVYYDRLAYALTVESDKETLTSGSGTYLFGASANVSAADIAGYKFLGWYDGETLVKTSREFSYEVKKDVTLKAKWEANNETKYKVSYYKQNVDNDEYTLIETVDFTGVTDQVAYAEIKTYEHFNHVTIDESVESGKIAADNSLALSVYYNRDLYTVSLSSDLSNAVLNGAGSYRYEKYVTISVDSLAGYIFKGWFSDDDERVSESRAYSFNIENNVSLNAKWEASNETQYKVSYYKQNVDNDEYTLIETLDLIGVTDQVATAVIKTYANLHHVTIDESVESGKIAADNSLELSVYYDRDLYTLSLSSELGGAILSGAGEYRYEKEISVSVGEIVGYNFDGWFDGETKVAENRAFNYKVVKVVSLRAKWSAKTNTAYTVEIYTQNIGDDDYSKELSQLSGTTDTLASAPVAPEHFVKVTKADSVESGNINGDGSLVLRVYYDREVYTVTVQGGDNAVATAGSGSYRYGKTITVSATSVGGFDFIDWKDGSTVVSEDHEFSYTVEKDVELVAKWYQNIFIGSVSQPLSLTEYYANRALKPDDLRNEFAYNENPYYVGDDNAFTMKPIVSFVNRAQEYVSQPTGWGVDVWNYVITLKIYNEEQSDYVPVDDISLYIDSIDSANCVIDFSANAIGQKLSLSIAPAGLVSKQKLEEKDYSTTFEISVIDGYNVTNALELIYINNIVNNKVRSYTTGYNDFDGATLWNAFAAEKGIDLSQDHKAIVLHNRINVTKNDIPAGFFYSESDEDVKETDVDYSRVIGSLKDHSDIYYRYLGENDAFVIEGNYFTLDCSAIPLVVRPGDETDAILEGEKFESHAQLIRFKSERETVSSNAEIRNIDLVGNAEKTANLQKAGGLILAKITETTFKAINNISNQWYINYIPFPNTKRVDISYCRAYDSFNCIVYLWGSSDAHIDHCDFNGSGGPVFIIDQQGQTKNATGDAKRYSGVISSLEITDSSMHSFVTGSEAWFDMYSASGVAAAIKSLNPAFAVGNRSFVVTGKKPDDKGDYPDYLDILAVYKSADEAGITNPVTITGYFNMNNAACPLDFGTYNLPAIYAAGDAELAAKMSVLKGTIETTISKETVTFVSSAATREITQYGDNYKEDGVGIMGVSGLIDGFMQPINSTNSLFKGDQIYLYHYLGLGVVLGYYNVGDTVDPTDIGSLIRER